MTNIVQTLRSSTPNTKPLVSTRQAGELWTNFPDLQLGLIDATQTSVPLIAVRYFSAATAYVGGDFAIQGGKLYVAKAAVPIGPFNASQWTAMQTAADVAAGYLPLSGGNLSGGISINAADPTFTLNKSAGPHGNTLVGQTAGKNRWALQLGNGSTESGSNTGSDFAIYNYDDGGTVSATVMSIQRNSGGVTFNGAATFNNSGGAIQLLPGIVSIGAPNASSNAQVSFYNPSGVVTGYCYWERADNSIRLLNPTHTASAAYIALQADGGISINGATTIFYGLVGALGWNGRQGIGAGAAGGQPNNFFWNNTALECWVSTTNLGNVTFTSDYRVKKDVQELPSMWETAKALRPISYTHKDYTPLNAVAKDGEDAPQPLFVSDETERWGFVAHELQETLVESAATGVKDQEDCIQSPNPWTVIATLTKALQEAMARIETLEARIA